MIALDGAFGDEGCYGWFGGEDVWDYVFEFAVLVPCACQWRRVVFSFGVEGDFGGVGGIELRC